MTFILTKGIATDTSYGAYSATQGSCKKIAASNLFKTPDFCYGTGINDDMLLFLMNKFNIAMGVLIQANNNFMNYQSGIFQDSTCSTALKDANHAVIGEV